MTPDNVKIEIKGDPEFSEIPDNVKNMIYKTMADRILDMFKDPKVQKDYEKWQAKRKKRAAKKEEIA